MKLFFKIKNRSFILITFFTLLFASCSEEIPQSDAQTLMLKGFVRSIEEEFYFASYNFDKVVLNEKLYKRYYLFDISGNYTEFIHINELAKKQADIKINNTVNCSITDSVLINHTDSISVTDSITGLVDTIRQQENINESLIEPDYVRREYKYFNDSIYIISYFDKRGYLLAYEDCRITSGKLRILNYFSNNDILLSKTDFEYDNKNRLISKIKYFEKTSYQIKCKYSFGRKYESFSYSAKHFVYSFNCSGLMKKQKNYIGSTHVSTIYYKYDDMNNLMSAKEADKITGEEKLSVYSYKYDEYGNWVERLEKRYDGNVFVTRRLIDYH